MQVSRGRFLRLFLLILVVAIAAILLVPRTVLTVRPNGTVNAKVITISAPIDGLLTRSTPDVGTPVSSGEIIAKIENRLEAQPLLAELDQQVNVARTLVDALSTKRKALIELRDRLLPQVDAFRVDSAISLRLQAVEAEARVRFWSAALNERGGALKRYRTLVSSGNVSKAAVEEAEALYLQAQEEINRAKADAERLNKEASAAAEGRLIGEGRNDVPYSQQRLDDIQIALADLEVQIAEAAVRADVLTRRYNEESTRVVQREGASLRAPVSGIIWRRFAVMNTSIGKDQPLTKILDCGTLYADVAIDEGEADDLPIGTPIKLRLQGGSRSYDSVVYAVRGTRAVTLDEEFAAIPPLLKKDEALLTVEIQDPEFTVSAENFCSVGRRVEVSFPRTRLGAVWALFE